MASQSGQLIDMWSRAALGRSPAELELADRESQNPVNKALRLADAEGFYKMCAPIAWGNENRQDLGEMLRGLVVSFLPKNRFHLQLLHNIASLQWQMQRLVALQRNLFEGNTGLPGRHRLPQGTHDAMSYGRELSRLNRDLQTAVQTYRLAVAESRG